MKNTTNPTQHTTDVLVIGSGAAGLSVALRLAHLGKITVLSKAEVTEGSTFYAQGGIAAVLDESDSVDSHVEDTLIAGAVCAMKNPFAIPLSIRAKPLSG